MMKVKDSYNLNRLSLVAANAALQDMPWMTRNARRIQRSRKRLGAALKHMGYLVYPSHANFVMARKPGQNLKSLYEELKRRKILVRYFDTAGLQDCLRITVGAPKEVGTLLKRWPPSAADASACLDLGRQKEATMRGFRVTEHGSHSAECQRHRSFAEVLHRGHRA